MSKIIIYGAETPAHIVLIRALKKAGLQTLVLAKHSASIGRYSICADEVLVIPTNPPSDEYLSNLIKHRKISHIITANTKDSLLLSELKEKDMLGDIIIMDQSLEILRIMHNKELIRSLFEHIEQPLMDYQTITHIDELENITLSMTYPVIFFDTDILDNQRKILYARNFMDFKRKASKILAKNNKVSIFNKKFHHLPLQKNHYLFINGLVKHIWHSQSYLLPCDTKSHDHAISLMPVKPLLNQKVDHVARQVAENLKIDNGILSIDYYQGSTPDDITYVDLHAGGTIPDVALFQKDSVKMIEARLRLYGFNNAQYLGKPLKSSRLYITGSNKYKALLDATDTYIGTAPPIFKTKFLWPLLDFDDLNPLICLGWRAVKKLPFYCFKSIRKFYTLSMISRNSKKFEPIKRPQQ